MQKAGGIIGLIAGVFGVLAAIATLFLGGIGAAFNADGASTIVGLGWGGILFSFLTIVLGAVATGAKSRIPGAMLMACAVSGAILGGGIVAIFMALAFIGGLIATMGSSTNTATTTT